MLYLRACIQHQTLVTPAVSITNNTRCSNTTHSVSKCYDYCYTTRTLTLRLVRTVVMTILVKMTAKMTLMTVSSG